MTGREDLLVPEIVRANAPRIEWSRRWVPSMGLLWNPGGKLSVAQAARLALERLEVAEPASEASG